MGDAVHCFARRRVTSWCYCAVSGGDLFKLSTNLGHSRVAITQQVCAHVYPTRSRTTAAESSSRCPNRLVRLNEQTLTGSSTDPSLATSLVIGFPPRNSGPSQRTILTSIYVRSAHPIALDLRRVCADVPLNCVAFEAYQDADRAAAH
jgi:hypothetical protein